MKIKQLIKTLVKHQVKHYATLQIHHWNRIRNHGFRGYFKEWMKDLGGFLTILCNEGAVGFTPDNVREHYSETGYQLFSDILNINEEFLNDMDKCL